MVDRQVRDEMAELLRHLASGTITVGQFAEEMPKDSKDRAVKCAVQEYHDLYEDLFYREWARRDGLKLDYPKDDQCLDCRFKVENALDSLRLDKLKHMVLFLQSDLEWPRLWQKLWLPLLVVLSPGIAFSICALINLDVSICLMSLFAVPVVTVTLWIRHNRCHQGVWPFLKCSDYEAALATPKLLAGKRE